MKTSLDILYIGQNPAYFEPLKNNNAVSVSVADSTISGINHLLSGKRTDAVFCDFGLSGANGFYIHDWIREQKKFNAIPFILLSKEFRPELYKTAYEKHVDDYYVTSQHMPLGLADRIEFLCGFRKKSKKETVTETESPVYKMPFSKRLFDIVVASTILLVLSPILLLIILAIRLESKGKVYYTSKRVGRKPFDFYKLRSMRTGADAMLKDLAKKKNQYDTADVQSDIDFTKPCPHCSEMAHGHTCSPLLYIYDHQICDYWFNTQKASIAEKKSAFVKIKDDPRITRVGKIIRNTSIDELPQLINVIKGDMSIVGNRPLPVYEAELLTVDTLSKRFLAPAGITGLWQVELRGKGGVMSEDERKRLDNEYADHFKDGRYSFWYDMKLILRTIPALFQKDSV